MRCLAHKISIENWTDARAEGVSADGLTNCLRTFGNTLSFWACESDNESTIDDAFLAYISSRPGSHTKDLDGLWMILVPSEDLESQGLKVSETRGATPVDELALMHRDVEQLNMRRLCSVAEIVARRVREDAYAVTRTREQMTRIICAAVNSKRLPIDHFEDGKFKKLIAEEMRRRA